MGDTKITVELQKGYKGQRERKEGSSSKYLSLEIALWPAIDAERQVTLPESALKR